MKMANLSLEIGILAQIGVLIRSASINTTPKIYSIVVMCMCLCKMHVKAVHGYI